MPNHRPDTEQFAAELVRQGTPIRCPRLRVLKDWIDYNGHMNMAFYHVAFDKGVDHVYDLLGVGEAYVAQGASCFTREVHVNYIQELELGASIDVTWQLLDWDHKRLHYFQHMYDGDGELVATSEQMALHVDMTTRRTAPFPADVQALLQQMLELHAQLKTPEQAGQIMQIRR